MEETTTTHPLRAGLIFESYTLDYQSIVHHAVRRDGQLFTRVQGKTPWGYSFSSWRPSKVWPTRFHPTGRIARLPAGEL